MGRKKPTWQQRLETWVAEKPPRIAPDASAAEKVDGLIEVAEWWFGPETEPDFDVAALEAMAIPEPLKRLWRRAGFWRNAFESNQDAIWSPSKGDGLDDLGRLRFAWENQGNWSCVTEPEGEDPPVWSDASGEWQKVNDSLADFLLTAGLYALVMQDWDSDEETSVVEEAESAEILWRGDYAFEGEPFTFVVLDDRVLGADSSLGWWCHDRPDH